MLHAARVFLSGVEHVSPQTLFLKAVESLKEELQQYGNLSEAEQTKLFRKLSARWHPDKHPDEKKVMATRVFQWIQHVKDEAWENRAWSA